MASMSKKELDDEIKKLERKDDKSLALGFKNNNHERVLADHERVLNDEKKEEKKEYKVVLLVDEPLKYKEEQLINELFKYGKFEPKIHSGRSIDEMGGFEVLCIDISNNTMAEKMGLERSAGMLFYEQNLPLFKDRGYHIIYYRKTECVRKDNLQRMKYDNRVVNLPDDGKRIKTKENYARIAFSDKMPQVRNAAVRFWQWLFRAGK